MVGVTLLSDNRVVVHSFVDGNRIVRRSFRETETDALARALWLERHGRPEQADEYLDDFIRRNSGAIRH